MKYRRVILTVEGSTPETLRALCDLRNYNDPTRKLRFNVAKATARVKPKRPARKGNAK